MQLLTIQYFGSTSTRAVQCAHTQLPSFGWCRFHVLSAGMRYSESFQIVGRGGCGRFVHYDRYFCGCTFRTTCAAGRLDGTQCDGVGFFIKTAPIHCIELAVVMVVMMIGRTTLMRLDTVSLMAWTSRRRFAILQRLVFDAAQVWNASFDLCQHV